MSGRLVSAVLVLASAAAACGVAPATAGTVPAPAERGELLSPQRIAAFAPPAQRAAWMHYLEESRRGREADRAAIEAELAELGRERWTPAPARRGSVLPAESTPGWFGGPEARRIADVIVSFQTPAGGWSKNLDYGRQPRQPGQSYASTDSWSYIGTFDNDATTEELRFLAKAYDSHGKARHRDAFLRGLEYTLRAQFPNGCWPQVYPLQGGYHDAATYNDEAMPNVLALLQRIARGEFGFVPDDLRRRAEASVRLAVECVLATQVVVAGRPTAWGQQHDPLTYEPVAARAYEHASLTGGESVEVMEFLMSLEEPDARVVEAVHAAAAWFREAAIYGVEYEFRRGPVEREGAGPLWARFYEIGTNRPIFSDRDGIIRYSWHELDEERRYGYAWYRETPARLLRRYESWAKRHPPSPGR